jgi:hypothetical protein
MLQSLLRLLRPHRSVAEPAAPTLPTLPTTWPSLPAAGGDRTWQAMRRPVCESDIVLGQAARHWLRRLPSRQRPVRLAATLPRLANRLAWCWPDPHMTDLVLDDLLVDRRGGRCGFPSEIRRELEALRRFNQLVRIPAPSQSEYALRGH